MKHTVVCSLITYLFLQFLTPLSLFAQNTPYARTILDAQTKALKKNIYGFDFGVKKVKAINLDSTPSLEIIAVEDDIKIFSSKTGATLWNMPDEYDDVYPYITSIEAADVNRDGYMELYFTNQNGLYVFNINQPVVNGRVATQELPHFPLTCAPNPSNGTFELTFEPKNSGKMTIQVLNTEGSLVFPKNVDVLSNGVQKQNFDLNYLPNGFYILQLKTETERAFQKIIIAK